MTSTVVTLFSAPAQQPNGEALIQKVRNTVAAQRLDVNGVMRKEGIKEVPVRAFFRGNNFQFFLNGERFHLKLGKDAAELFTIDQGGNLKGFPSERLAQSISESDVTFEDFSLLFLYWPKAHLEGEDKIDGQDCYRVQVDNPAQDGAYKSVFVWVHKKYGTFWRIKGFGHNGMPLKLFQVTSVIEIANGGYGIKSMQISTLRDDGRIKAFTRLDFDQPEIKSLQKR